MLSSAIYMQSRRQVRFRRLANAYAEESSIEQIEYKHTRIHSSQTRIEDQHMAALLKSNQEIRRTLSPGRGISPAVFDHMQEDPESLSDRTEPLHDYKSNISKKLSAAKAKAQQETEQARNEILSGGEDFGGNQVRGCVKCEGSKDLWLNFTLATDQKSRKVTLTVKERSKNGKHLAKQQVLSETYIKAVTGDQNS